MGWILQQPVSNPASAIASIKTACLYDKLNKFSKELNSYDDLKENWDYYKSKTFSKQFLSKIEDTVVKIINIFNQADNDHFEITPCPLGDGRVDVEIESLFKRVIFTFDPNSDTVEVGIIGNVLGQTQCPWNDENIANIVLGVF